MSEKIYRIVGMGEILAHANDPKRAEAAAKRWAKKIGGRVYIERRISVAVVDEDGRMREFFRDGL